MGFFTNAATGFLNRAKEQRDEAEERRSELVTMGMEHMQKVADEFRAKRDRALDVDRMAKNIAAANPGFDYASVRQALSEGATPEEIRTRGFGAPAAPKTSDSINTQTQSAFGKPQIPNMDPALNTIIEDAKAAVPNMKFGDDVTVPPSVQTTTAPSTAPAQTPATKPAAPEQSVGDKIGRGLGSFFGLGYERGVDKDVINRTAQVTGMSREDLRGIQDGTKRADEFDATGARPLAPKKIDMTEYIAKHVSPEMLKPGEGPAFWDKVEKRDFPGAMTHLTDAGDILKQKLQIVAAQGEARSHEDSAVKQYKNLFNKLRMEDASGTITPERKQMLDRMEKQQVRLTGTAAVLSNALNGGSHPGVDVGAPSPAPTQPKPENPRIRQLAKEYPSMSLEQKKKAVDSLTQDEAVQLKSLLGK